MSVVAVGFLVGLLVPCLVFLGGWALLAALGVVAPSHVVPVRHLLGPLAVSICRVAGLAGLLAGAGGVLAYLVAGLRRWLAERRLTRLLGCSPTVGAKDRTLVLERLDLDESDHRVVARARWADRASTVLGVLVLACFGVIIPSTYEFFLVEAPWAFQLLKLAGTLVWPLIAAFIVVGLQSDAARHLVALQVTLNRIEAAGKGKG